MTLGRASTPLARPTYTQKERPVAITTDDTTTLPDGLYGPRTYASLLIAQRYGTDPDAEVLRAALVDAMVEAHEQRARLAEIGDELTRLRATVAELLTRPGTGVHRLD